MSPKIVDYIILESNYTKQRADGVRQMLQKGCVPVGGVSYIKTQNMIHNELVAQAMVQYEQVAQQ